MKKIKLVCLLMIFSVMASLAVPVFAASDKGDEVVLRICNWEEYIDEGEWEEDEVIDLESGDIFGENSILDDFADWYYETYGKKVRVEYSTFGTNEDLYNMLTLGDVYDLVCPSEYMIMKAQMPILEEYGMLNPRGPEGEYPSLLDSTLLNELATDELERNGLPVDRKRLSDLIDAYQGMRAQLLSEMGKVLFVK